MKNEEEIILELNKVDSEYYAGSACLLSLVAILKHIENNILYFDEAFPDVYKIVDKLIDGDGKFFKLSLKKEKLTDEEWDEVKNISIDYLNLFDDLNKLKELFIESGMNRYLPFIENKFVLLANLAQNSIAEFFDKDDIPEDYLEIGNSVLLAIRG